MPGLALQGAEHVDAGPAVRRLPDDVRRGQRGGDHAAEQQVAAAQQAAGVGGEEAGGQRGDQEGDVPLGLAGHPGAAADGQPPPRIPAGEQAHHQVQRDRPEHEVGHGGGQLVHRSQVLAAGRRRERGEELAGPARAEQAAHRGGEHHQGGEAERGHHPEPDQGVAGQHRGQAGYQRGEGRLVDVTERQVMPAGEEVKLVPHVPVARAHGHFNAERGRRDDADREPGCPLGRGPPRRAAGCPRRRARGLVMLAGSMLAGSAPRWSCSCNQHAGKRVAATSGTEAICWLPPTPECGAGRRPPFRRLAEPPVHPAGRSAAASPGRTIGS